jgi:hypothetical protein
MHSCSYLYAFSCQHAVTTPRCIEHLRVTDISALAVPSTRLKITREVSLPPNPKDWGAYGVVDRKKWRRENKLGSANNVTTSDPISPSLLLSPQSCHPRGRFSKGLGQETHTTGESYLPFYFCLFIIFAAAYICMSL